MIKLYRGAAEERIASLAKDNDHRALAIWAAECAERVLPLFEAERPHDRRPRAAIEALREFIATGRFSMKVVREASLSAHAAARAVPDGPARYAARAAGQAVATAHVPAHSRAAALYAAKAIGALEPENGAVENEREWQCRRLAELTTKRGDAEAVRLFRR